MWRSLIAVVLLAVLLLVVLDVRQPGSVPVAHHESTPTERHQTATQKASLPTRTERTLPPAGESIRIELIDPPLAKYGPAKPTEADSVYAHLVDDLRRPDLIYDANLGHAARELAYLHSLFDGLVPQPAVNFLLRSAGAIDKSVLQAYASTSGDSLDAVRSRLVQLVGDRRDRVRRIGIGEAYIPGAARGRFIAMLVSERQITVNPAPKIAQANTTWLLSGTLPDGWSKPTALSLYPNGELATLIVRSEGRRFSLEVPTGADAGTLDVSLSAIGPYGPAPLLQIPVHVGQPLPTALDVLIPPNESDVENATAAEALAFSLLNADRERYGLPPLQRAVGADRVARAHSVDMRDNGFFGHWSEETGAPGDRLLAADLKSTTYAENVAFGGSIHGAEVGLMHSLGHRRNILNRQFTHVGIGVAGRAQGDTVQWHLTQLFMVPATILDRAGAESQILSALDSTRRASARRALARSPGLDRLTERAARIAAAGGTEDAVSTLLASAKDAGQLRRGGFAWVRAITDLNALGLPDEAASEQYTRVGLSVIQLDDHPNGLIGVALLLAAPR